MTTEQKPRPDRPMPETTELISTWLIAYPPKTRAGYRLDIDQFTQWLDNTPLLEANRADIQRWLAHLLDARKLTPGTARRKASAVWSFYNYCVQEDVLLDNPAEYVRRPKGDSPPKFGLPLDQAQSLVAAAEAHSRPAAALVWLMMGVGLRVAEACSATIENLDGNLLRVIVKGGHEQIKPLGPGALNAVTAAIGDRTEGTILINRDGKPLSQRRAFALIDKLAAQCGIDNCTPHTLRHTAATLALAAGAQVQDVKELLGHRSIETTLRYIRNRDILGGSTNAADRLAASIKGTQ